MLLQWQSFPFILLTLDSLVRHGALLFASHFAKARRGNPEEDPGPGLKGPHSWHQDQFDQSSAQRELGVLRKHRGGDVRVRLARKSRQVRDGGPGRGRREKRWLGWRGSGRGVG